MAINVQRGIALFSGLLGLGRGGGRERIGEDPIWGALGREIALREYREPDLEAMYDLDRVCFSEDFRFDRQSMQRFAESHNALVVVAAGAAGAEAGLAGFAIAHLEGSEQERYGYVVTLNVAPEYRRNGLARALLGALERRARMAGAGRMELHVSAENDGAIQFYQRSGYVGAGRQEDFYGAGLDGLGYWKVLA
jgi:ribosomal-protein-alanine N-acetyltransferase